MTGDRAAGGAGANYWGYLLAPSPSVALMNLQLVGGSTPWILAAGILAGLALALLAGAARARLAHRAERALLHPLSRGDGRLAIYVRGLFVPGGEYYSRAPEDPRHPAGGLTVHKWSRVEGVHAAADVQAAATLVRLLGSVCPRVVPDFRAGDPGRPAWGEHGIIVGPHYLAYQVLDGCTPRLASIRPAASVRLLGPGRVFEAREELDFGLIYKGERSGVRRSYLLVTGLGDAGTGAAAAFLARHAAALGRVVGRGGFALVVAVHPARGPASATLQGIEPRPTWWRRMLHRKDWQALHAAAPPDPVLRRATGGQPAVPVRTPPERPAAAAPVGAAARKE